jgi:hypothetical protein
MSRQRTRAAPAHKGAKKAAPAGGKAPKVADLTALCVAMREKSNGISPAEAYDLLFDLVGDTIGIVFELIEDGVSKPVFPRGKLAGVDSSKINRVMLTSNKQSADFKHILVRQCNGIILEYGTWKALAVPPQMFCPKPRMAEVRDNLAAYDIYEIKDGTTVTFYYNSVIGGAPAQTQTTAEVPAAARPQTPGWCVSTVHGYCVNDYKMIGETTYMQDILAVTARSCPEFSFDKLDPAKCYTIGYHHPEFHPMPTEQGAWLIQVCDLTDLNSTQPKLTICDVAAANIGIPPQLPVTINIANPREAWARMTDANTKSIEALRQSRPHYGYVLRGRAINGRAPPPDVILESKLFEYIRKNVYNVPKHRDGFTPILPKHRAEFVTLRAYLSNSTKFTYMTLFPQYVPLCKRYDVIFDDLTDRIIKAMRDNDKKQQRQANTMTDRLVLGLSSHIAKAGINVNNRESKSIIQDFLLNPGNIDLYYECMIVNPYIMSRAA